MHSANQLKRGFYDLETSPVSFDFATFLMNANANDCDEVVVVPGSEPVDQQRLDNIIKGLWPDVKVMPSRERAIDYLTEQRFPDGYNVRNPRPAHGIGKMLFNRKVVPLRPNDEKWQELEDDGLTAENLVVITIRECKSQSRRNSNIAEWLKVADWLKSRQLEPIFVPDTENPDRTFGSHKVSKKAALDVQYRLALYEKAHLNLGVMSGPMFGLVMISARPFLIFRPTTYGYEETSDKFWSDNGIPFESQLQWFTTFQRIIWNGLDTFDNVRENLERWLKARDEKVDPWPPHVSPNYPIIGVGDHEVRGKQMSVAMEKAKEYGWKFMTRQTHCQEVMSLVGYGPSLKDTWQYIKRPILTVGGAHDFLVERGIVPDFHVDCDPRAYKAQMLNKPQKSVRYCMATCLHPDWWEKLKEFHVELWHLHNDKYTDIWIAKNDPNGLFLGGGSTVGMRALEVASCLGYKRFHVHGYDNSYESDDSRHAGPHVGKKQKIISVKVDGRDFKTSPQMLEASKEMIQFIQMYDAELTFWGDGLQQHMVRFFLRRFRVMDTPKDQKAA